jgi:thioredoxin reductase (NADPH)
VLAAHAARVTLIHRGAALDAQKVLVERVAAEPKIEVMLNSTVEEILGEETVSAVRLFDHAGKTERMHETRGVFVYVGLDPNTAFLRGLVELDATGHIETDIMMRTSVDGIFAAGDIRAKSVATLAAAAGDGATAAIAAVRYLEVK